jgi:hypothetical protein
MINTKRLWLAFVAALVTAYVYEFVVYGVALHSFHAMQPRWLKPENELPMLRMYLSDAVGVALLTVFYALFARAGAARLSTGVVFGIFVGLIAGWMPQVYNKLLLVDWPFYKVWAPAGFGEFLVIGIVLGLVYRNP